MKSLLVYLLCLATTVVLTGCQKKDPNVVTAATAATACSAQCEPGDGLCPACRDNPNCRVKEGTGASGETAAETAAPSGGEPR